MVLVTYGRNSFHTRTPILRAATLTLHANEIHHSGVASDPSIPVDIWSALTVTPENNVATVRMFAKFCEERRCV